jgi:hypothetical protein
VQRFPSVQFVVRIHAVYLDDSFVCHNVCKDTKKIRKLVPPSVKMVRDSVIRVVVSAEGDYKTNQSRSLFVSLMGKTNDN